MPKIGELLSIRYNRKAQKDIKTPIVAQLKREELFPPDFNSLPIDQKKQKREIAASQLHIFYEEKAIDPPAVHALTKSRLSGILFSNLVLRDADRTTEEEITNALDSYPMRRLHKRKKQGYAGIPEENILIDRAIAESPFKDDIRREYARAGATRMFDFGDIEREAFNEVFSNTQVIVIGAGAAGTMTVRGLLTLGFDPDNITVIDKKGEYGGIWNQENLLNGSINSPFQFDFEGITLDPAPGSGSEAREFLREIEDLNQDFFASEMPKVLQGTVIAIKPDDLSHTVTVEINKSEERITAPLVIYAGGLRKSLYPSREGHMLTDTPAQAGVRWQKILTAKDAEKYRGKTLILIGLGNSTAEMLMQIKKLNEQGYNIDYRVLTHYSESAVFSPKSNGIYRNLTLPNLTKYEGDLAEAQEAYELALRGGKIISNVEHWHAEKKGTTKEITITRNKQEQITLAYEQLFTLIGYGNDPEQMRQMGMKVIDEYKGTVETDYDGEVRRPKPVRGAKTRRGDIYPGYFVIGAAAQSDSNPNLVVMPGIMHRMYDLLHTSLYRAQENYIREHPEDFKTGQTRQRNVSRRAVLLGLGGAAAAIGGGGGLVSYFKSLADASAFQKEQEALQAARKLQERVITPETLEENLNAIRDALINTPGTQIEKLENFSDELFGVFITQEGERILLRVRIDNYDKHTDIVASWLQSEGLHPETGIVVYNSYDNYHTPNNFTGGRFSSESDIADAIALWGSHDIDRVENVLFTTSQASNQAVTKTDMIHLSELIKHARLDNESTQAFAATFRAYSLPPQTGTQTQKEQQFTNAFEKKNYTISNPQLPDGTE